LDLPIEKDYAKHVYYLYVIRYKFRDKLQEFLKSEGIETLIHYPIPIYLQEAYKDLGYKRGDFSVVEASASRIISLPIYSELERNQVRTIAEAINKIEKYIKDENYDSFSGKDFMIDAVIRELEIIGEAAYNIEDGFQKNHPDIPWDEMKGMRNRLIHEYFGVNTKIVWETCKKDLPELEKLISKHIPII